MSLQRARDSPLPIKGDDEGWLAPKHRLSSTSGKTAVQLDTVTPPELTPPEPRPSLFHPLSWRNFGPARLRSREVRGSVHLRGVPGSSYVTEKEDGCQRGSHCRRSRLGSTWRWRPGEPQSRRPSKKEPASIWRSTDPLRQGSQRRRVRYRSPQSCQRGRSEPCRTV